MKNFFGKVFALIKGFFSFVVFLMYFIMPTFALFAWKYYVFAGTGYAFLICFVLSVFGTCAVAYLSFEAGVKAAKE